tara:strand:+ start:1112 stop:2029 length:918 start_codon:yes stop_codon:yes gene_type:complete
MTEERDSTENNLSTPKYFNKIYRDFVKEVAETFPEYKISIINQYTDLLNKESELEDGIYVNEYMKSIQPYIEAIIDEDDTIFDTNDRLYFLREVDFSYIWKQKMTDHTRKQLRKYLKTLYLIGTKLMSVSTEVNDIIQQFYNNEDNIDVQSLDDETKKMVKILESITPNIVEDNKIKDEYEKLMENSSIGKLAQEIAGEINFDNVDIGNIEKPADIMSNLMGDGFMSIVQNVGSKIQDKISSGQLDSGKLLGEAQQMMSMMGGNQFQDLFSNLAGQQTAQSNSNQSRRNTTRDRLRKKLEKRKNK